MALEVSVPKHRCLSVCLNKHLICTIPPPPHAGLKLSFCHTVTEWCLLSLKFDIDVVFFYEKNG